MDVLHRSWKNSAEVASIGLVAEALDENARTFCLHHESRSLADQPGKLFIATATFERAFHAHWHNNSLCEPLIL